jgi:hypothetical protein
MNVLLWLDSRFDIVFFFLAVWARLKLEGVAQFSLSPGKAPAIAVFIPEKNVSFFMYFSTCIWKIEY